MYRELIENMIDLYGNSCSIYFPDFGAPMQATAFITPFHYKTSNFAGTEYNVNGFIRRDCYLYVGKVMPNLSFLPRGSRIVCGGRAYRVENSEIYTIKNEPIYCRATLRLFEGGNAFD